ncbi:MAG: diacylglyceryl transferase [Chitinophagales bacterium]|nr:diacylglyceryl transferase [Chitinophagales bacterium]
MTILKAYPKITDLINDIFGTSLNLPIYSFGFFVGMAFLIAMFVLSSELKRRYALGIFEGYKSKLTVGEPAKPMDIILNLIIGFVFGFKALAAAQNWDLFVDNPQEFLFSGTGSVIGGIIGAIALAGYTYYQKQKKKLDPPVVKEVKLYPHQLIGEIVTVAMISGVLGSKVFYWFESPGNFSEFLNDPLGTFFSGLTIYGGLTFGALSLLIYSYLRKIKIPHLFDALAPSFMLAYGIGRIGCQVSGDGDWGIPNPNPKPDWIPQFLWSDRYENNIGQRCCYSDSTFCDCNWAETPYLVDAVYPTPIYEFMMASVLFLILWSLRKKLTIFPGLLFGVFLIFNGVERFLIEKIRVNTKLDFLGMQLTQAEIVSTSVVIIGVALSVYIYMRNRQKSTSS